MNPDRITDDEKTITTIKRKRNVNNNHNIVTTNQNDDTDDDILLLESLINPNFEELSRQFIEFRIAYQHIIQLQKNDTNKIRGPIQSYMTQEFTISLTKALLHVYFHGISLCNIPDGNLCPPVPNRYYFVQWIRNTLLPLTKRHHNNYDQYLLYFDNCWKNDDTKEVPNGKGNEELSATTTTTTNRQTIYGLDIGTGATCIYPILMVASSLMFGHHQHNQNNEHDIIKMYATDIDIGSIQCANENVTCNVRLRNHIHVVHIPPSETQQILLLSTATATATNQTMNVSNNPSNDPNQYLLQSSSMLSSSSSSTSSSFPFRIGPLRRSLESCFRDKNSNNNKNGDMMIGEKDNNDHCDFHLDFCMTNPPFYNSCDPTEVMEHNEVRRSGDGRERTNMTLSEGFYPDGEVGFMIDILFDVLYLFFIKNSNNQHYKHQSSSSTTDDEILLSSSLADQQQQSLSMNQLLPIPFWICYMVGTKSSFIVIRHILEQLLGYSHLHITEFGPGKLTRWFIAYTLEKPNIRSPLAKIIDNIPWKFSIQYTSSSFSSLLENSNKSNSNNTTMLNDDNYYKNKFASLCLSDVIDRMKEYCRDFPHHQLFVTVHDDEKALTHLESSSQKNMEHKQIIHFAIQERIDDNHFSLYHTNMWPGDDELPQRFQQILQQNYLSSTDRMKFFIPKEGHFLLDATLTCDILMTSSKHDNNTNNLPLSSISNDVVGTVQIHITSYRHTLYGMKIIQKIKSQFEGEICRINRRWRRKLAHEKDQHQQQAPDYSSTTKNNGMSIELQTMDET